MPAGFGTAGFIPDMTLISGQFNVDVTKLNECLKKQSGIAGGNSGSGSSGGNQPPTGGSGSSGGLQPPTDGSGSSGGLQPPTDGAGSGGPGGAGSVDCSTKELIRGIQESSTDISALTQVYQLIESNCSPLDAEVTTAYQNAMNAGSRRRRREDMSQEAAQKACIKEIDPELSALVDLNLTADKFTNLQYAEIPGGLEFADYVKDWTPPFSAEQFDSAFTFDSIGSIDPSDWSFDPGPIEINFEIPAVAAVWKEIEQTFTPIVKSEATKIAAAPFYPGYEKQAQELGASLEDVKSCLDGSNDDEICEEVLEINPFAGADVETMVQTWKDTLPAVMFAAIDANVPKSANGTYSFIVLIANIGNIDIGVILKMFEEKESFTYTPAKLPDGKTDDISTNNRRRNVADEVGKVVKQQYEVKATLAVKEQEETKKEAIEKKNKENKDKLGVDPSPGSGTSLLAVSTFAVSVATLLSFSI
jgi:hypothetical protein